MAYISVVTPVYQCAECIEELYMRLCNTLEKINPDYEIIFINDGSPDRAWEIIGKLANNNSKVKGINFSRNFGQHNAITAGLRHSKGEWIVVMDCDLQDQPEEITKMLNKAHEGYEIVFGRRYKRKDNFFKKIFSFLFYALFNYFTESKFDSTIGNYSIVNRKVVRIINELKEHSRSYPLFLMWTGFSYAKVDIEHAARQKGKSSYSFGKLLNFAIESIVFQSNKPLKLSIKVGLLMSVVSMLFGGYFIVKKMLFGIPIIGWASIIVSMFFIAGLIFANIGLLGIYLGKVHEETKGRPLFVVRDYVGFEENKQSDDN